MTDQVTVEVVYVSETGVNWRRTLEVPAGCSVRDAVSLSGAPEAIADYDWSSPQLGVFGQRADSPDQDIVHAGDQIEIYRPLIADPKLRRKRRAENTSG